MNQINHPKFRARNLGERNDEPGTYSPNKQIKFQKAMLRSSSCDYSDAYILVIGNISVNNTGTAAAPTNGNKKVKFKNCATIY